MQISGNVLDVYIMYYKFKSTINTLCKNSRNNYIIYCKQFVYELYCKFLKKIIYVLILRKVLYK